MSDVRQVTKARIRQILDSNSWAHQVDDDGDFVVPLAADDDVPYDVLCFVVLEQDRFLSVRLLPDRQVPAGKKGEALLACNDWNRSRRWPSAFLEQDASRVMGEWHVDLQYGVHDALLADMIVTIIGSGWQLYKEFSKAGL